MLRGGTSEEQIARLQQAVNCWESSLSTTSGAIVPQKSYWYLIDFLGRVANGVTKASPNAQGISPSKTLMVFLTSTNVQKLIKQRKHWEY
jgi:hypothetical protein